MRVFTVFIIFAIYARLVVGDPPDCSEEPGVLQLYYCCDIPFTSNIYEKCKYEILRKALNDSELEAEIRNNELVFEMCTAECEFRKKQFLRGLNDIDFEAVRKDLEKYFPHEMEYAQSYIKGMHDCMDYARDKALKYVTVQNSGCSFFPGFLRKCAFHVAIKSCSPERWHFSEKCSEIKNWLENCDVLK